MARSPARPRSTTAPTTTPRGPPPSSSWPAAWPPRRVVFMAFTAEEMGLLGSAHYAEHPLDPRDNTVYMINFDMVGRLNAQGVLHVYGAWTTPGMEDVVSSLAKSAGLQPKLAGGT